MQRAPLSALALALPLIALACSLPSADDGEMSAPNHAVTSFGGIPSPTGDALSLELMPILDDVNTTSPMPVSAVGPTIIVAASSASTAVDTLRTGISHVVLGPNVAFVVQSDTTSWALVDYAVGPPPATYAHVTRVDRSTLAVTGTRDLSPVAQSPFAFDDHSIIDVAASGTSDGARDIYIRVFDVDGSDAPSVLLDDQGFDGVSCVGTTGVAIAYEPASAPGTTSIVSAKLVSGSWTVSKGSIAGARIDATGMACTTDASRVLVSLEDSTTSASRVDVYDVPSQLVVIEAANYQGPLALRSDGAAAVAMKVDDQSLAWIDSAGPKALGLTSAPVSPLVTNDLALWTVKDGLALIHLADGTIEPTIGVDVSAYEVGGGSVPVTWPAGGGFIAPITSTDTGDYQSSLTSLLLIRAGKTDSLPLGVARQSPSLFNPSGNTLFLVTNNATDQNAHLLAYDLPSLTLTSEAPFSTCDQKTMLARQGCLP